VNTIGLVYLEHASSELSTLDSMSVGLVQAGRSVITGFSVASESIRAAFVANDVNKTQKKLNSERIKASSETKETLTSELFHYFLMHISQT
jgi:hypothetical protein